MIATGSSSPMLAAMASQAMRNRNATLNDWCGKPANTTVAADVADELARLGVYRDVLDLSRQLETRLTLLSRSRPGVAA